jgi:predicted nucleic acid-binding Zn ribbon protein
MDATYDRPHDRPSARPERSGFHDTMAETGHDPLADELDVSADEVDATVVEPRCVICSSPTDEVETCCSLACAQLAERELQRNVARIRRMTRHVASTEARRRVAERNGRLSSALLRWRPDTASSVAGSV